MLRNLKAGIRPLQIQSQFKTARDLSIFFGLSRDVGSISNLGGTTLRGHFFLKKQGAISKIKKGTAFFVAKS